MAKCNVFLQFGQSKNKHFLFINNIASNLGEDVCKKLLSIHCLTGCDTTCALFKIGKKTAFDILYKNIDALKGLENLPFLPEDEAINLSQLYVLYLYKNKNANIKTLNELRVHLTKESNRSASELPPTNDAFKQHLKRY